MELYLCCTNDTDILTSDHQIVTLPSGYTSCEIGITSQHQNGHSDILRLTKEIELNERTYLSETKFSSIDLLNCITAGVCLSQKTFNTKSCSVKSDMKYLIKNIILFSDNRDISWFALQLDVNAKPILCKIHYKYYTASFDIAISFGSSGKTSIIYGILRSNVPIMSSDNNTVIADGEPIYFKIPEKTLLWNNSIVLAEEDGEEYLANNGIPLLSVWNRQ